MKIKKSLLNYITVGCVLACIPNNSFANEVDTNTTSNGITLNRNTDIEQAISNAQTLRTKEAISTARELVNELDESDSNKANYQNMLNQIVPDLSLVRQNTTANVDVYIKSENMLLVSLNTNTINFEEYSGLQEIVNNGAVTINVNSSLSYQVKATLLDEIKSQTGQKIDKSLLTIKATGTDEYKPFTDINAPVLLLDAMPAGNGKSHGVDLRLAPDNAHKADIYRTVIKFEVNQL